METILMDKNILVLTGSPRKNGNSFAMTDAFIQATQTKGHTVKRFDTAFMDVGGCHGCMTCYKTGKACSFDDDYNLIAPEILAADAVVFPMPVYWYTMPAQIKAVLNKTFSLYIGKQDIAGKACALIVCCEEHNLTVLDGVKISSWPTPSITSTLSVARVTIPANVALL
jgi:multimeric flavodoxin WrbA